MLGLQTVKQLVDQNEVVLNVLFRNLAKVRLHNVDEFKEQFEYHRGVHILLCNGREPYVGSLKSKRSIKHLRTKISLSIAITY